MSIKEIEKLREKVENDPNSKLFVPLAEEYRKEGMLDDAVQVLRSGLDRQPGYMSARVLLGKIYLEKGMAGEARAEFESVTGAIPDNLFAHKKLAEIYRDSGDRNMAARAYRTVLKLNAMDEDALINLRSLQEEEAGAEEMLQAGAFEPSYEEEAEAFAIAEEETEGVTETIEDAVPAGGTEAAGREDDAFNEFVMSFGAGEAAAEGAGKPDDEFPGQALTEEAAVEAEEAEPEVLDDVEFGGFGEATAETRTYGELPEAEEFGLSEEGFGSMEEVFGAEKTAAAQYEPSGEDTAPAHDFTSDLDEADRMIAAGNFGGALNAYGRILARAPGDRGALQRVEELKSLLKLMGKEKEVLIDRLTGFLDRINKRRDEFFRSS